MEGETRKTVAIAGSTGFVGTALARFIRDEHRVICLSRSQTPPKWVPGMEWRTCDLFSLYQCEQALKGVDTAFYLVHSMLPSARLSQGAFEDMDLIIADNFARAAAKAGVKQIVYLGGLVPDESDLSRHIRSRYEVEKALGQYGVPVTALRAGIVIGPAGSSFSILLTLIRRIPVIPCPGWTGSLTQPIALSDVLRLLKFCLDHPSPESRSFDIGAPEALTYRELLERTAKAAKMGRKFFTLPIKNPFFCRRGLSLVTGAPPALVVPLLESMKHSLVARNRKLHELAGVPGVSIETAIERALEGERVAGRDIGRERLEKMARKPEARDVRSVQRIVLPPGKTARWVAEQYSAWLPRVFRFFLVAEMDSRQNVRILLRFPRVSLLEHSFSEDRSIGTDRQLFFLTGGLLVGKPDPKATGRPRLEFREVLGGAYVLAAIHEYRPTLPWLLYNLTQAPLHVWVMKRFANYIARKVPAAISDSPVEACHPVPSPQLSDRE